MFTIFDAADRQVDRTDRAIPTQLSTVIATSDRLLSLKRQAKTARLDSLLANRAWTEAALELLSLGAPEWTVGRLCRFDGEWLCTLTRHPDVPDWLDDSIEHTDRSLQLALLGAVLEAVRQKNAVATTTKPTLNVDQLLSGSDCR